MNPKDVAIYLYEQQVTEMRAMMRRLLDSEGAEATAAMAEAEKYLDSLDTVDREEEFDRWRDAGCPEDGPTLHP